MVPVELRAYDSRFIERVLIPHREDTPWPQLIAWGSRFFIHAFAGPEIYQEVHCLQVFTERETAVMERGAG
jgi:hypothetical protein